MTGNDEDEKTVMQSLRVPASLYQRAIARAIEDDRSFSSLVRISLRYYLDNTTPSNGSK